MTLKVVSGNTGQKITSVGNNYGMQYGVAPRQTSKKSTQILQPTKKASTYQGSSYNPQKTVNSKAIQQAETARKIAQAREAIRLRVEQARILKIKQQKIISGINTKTSTNKQNILKVVNSAPNATIKLPKITAQQKAYNDAYKQALQEFEDHKKQQSGGFLGIKNWSGWNESQARKWAQKRAEELMNTGVTARDAEVKWFEQEKARRIAVFEKLKTTAKTNKELNDYVDNYNSWVSNQADFLNKSAYRLSGFGDAYTNNSNSKLQTNIGKALSFTNRNVIQQAGKPFGWFARHTLGAGDENIPSIVRAPARIYNWLGNLNTNNRTIYNSDGTTSNRLNTGKNSWQSTFGQRNKNTRPWVDITVDQAPEKLKIEAQSLINARRKAGTTDPDKLNYDKVLSGMVAGYNRLQKRRNTAEELISDPLNLFWGSGTGTKFVSKAVSKTGIFDTKAGAWVASSSNKVSATKAKIIQSPIVKKLLAEAKTPQQKLADVLKSSKAQQSKLQKDLLPRINQLNKKLNKNQRLDVSVFDDLKRLTDSEARILQRISDGTLSRRDRLLLAGRNNRPIRQKLEDIAKRWTDFTEQMKEADSVYRTGFGRGKKLYSPRTSWLQNKGKSLDNYDFRLKRKFKGQQTKEDFLQGATDRYFVSNLDQKFAENASKKTVRRLQERTKLLEKYDAGMTGLRGDVEKAYAKTRTPYARVQSALGAPTRLWKKSVLKYRPAWTVNNVLYNTQAGVLAGGRGALAEQAKMLRPNYWRKAMDSVPDGVRSNISKEIGKKGKLNKFYSGVEDWSRVSAFKALKKQGLSDEKAIKRVNDYLFDYTTRNWERPLKTLMPFWAWQKNLTKASIKMPFDKPGGAIAYNRTDRYQQNQYDKEFEKMTPELLRLGYTEDEITKFKEENSKYFKGRLKVGNKWITTPFNAFSEKGLGSAGFNPFLTAGTETADGVGSFGEKLGGGDASFLRRLTSKFPQADWGRQAFNALSVQKGRGGFWGKVGDKLPIKQFTPEKKWVGAPASEGFGLGKSKQGYDSSLPNYDSSLDPRKKLGQNALSFVGIPRSLGFDTSKFIETKKLQKVSDEYFANSSKWSDMEFAKSDKERKAFFKKWGISEDDFYKGVLSKYDTSTTKWVKKLKEEARFKNKSLFEEYGKQPKGTRNLWATNKLRELNKSGYFGKNPFLKSFDWVNPKSVSKADKQSVVQKALKTGDWSEWRRLYGDSGLSKKALAYRKAKDSGDWSEYAKTYGIKSEEAKLVQEAIKTGDWSKWRAKYGEKTQFTYKGKFFKSAGTRDKYISGEFWRKYSDATPEQRKKLLADNPQFNDRKDWTSSQWQTWRTAKQKEQRKNILGYSPTRKKFDSLITSNKQSANKFLEKQMIRRSSKKLKYLA